MVGPTGYLADISRTLLCPGRPATGNQRKLYELAQAQILHNANLIEPGMSFAEFGARCWPVPDEYLANRYSMMVHGAGLVDESPVVPYAADYDKWGYDGVFEENMVVCVESYIGEEGGAEGVKLEEQLLLTKKGAVPMSSDPYIGALNT
jgi:Xaa-Pro aminopeptidase